VHPNETLTKSISFDTLVHIYYLQWFIIYTTSQGHTLLVKSTSNGEMLGCRGDYVVLSNLRPCRKRFPVCLFGHCYDDSAHDITVETSEAERVLQAENTILCRYVACLFLANAFENRRTQNNGFLVENVRQNAEKRGTFEGPLCLEYNNVLEKHAHECHRGTAE
jgi:hypothetical protein